MELGIEGKVAVVTGASRGIGRAIAEELKREGVLVVAGARNIEPLAGLDLVAVQVDLSTPEGPATLIRAAIDHHGGLDFLINNVAGARIHTDGFGSITDADWQFAFETTFMSAVRASRAAIPHITERRGAIVNVSSMNGRMPSPEIPEYSAMKAALNNLTVALAATLAPQGVRVNSVSPGPILTDMQVGPGGVAEQLGVAADEYSAEMETAVPLGRWGMPAEVAATVVTLLSGRVGYVTGTDVVVDGGLASR